MPYKSTISNIFFPGPLHYQNILQSPIFEHSSNISQTVFHICQQHKFYIHTSQFWVQKYSLYR